jgi:hypothetical protein
MTDLEQERESASNVIQIVFQLVTISFSKLRIIAQLVHLITSLLIGMEMGLGHALNAMPIVSILVLHL